MTVETNNIAALRLALEKLEALEEALLDVPLDDMDDDQVDDNLDEIKNILRQALGELEKPLINAAVLPEEYIGRHLYAGL